MVVISVSEKTLPTTLCPIGYIDNSIKRMSWIKREIAVSSISVMYCGHASFVRLGKGESIG